MNGVCDFIGVDLSLFNGVEILTPEHLYCREKVGVCDHIFVYGLILITLHSNMQTARERGRERERERERERVRERER